MRQQPVLTAGGIIGAIYAMVAFSVAMGWIDMDVDQMGMFEAMLWAVVPIVMSLAITYGASRLVTPLVNPKDNNGTSLVPMVGEELSE